MAVEAFKDISIYYELHGQGHPVVLIAGYGCDRRCCVNHLLYKIVIYILDSPV